MTIYPPPCRAGAGRHQRAGGPAQRRAAAGCPGVLPGPGSSLCTARVTQTPAHAPVLPPAPVSRIGDACHAIRQPLTDMRVALPLETARAFGMFILKKCTPNRKSCQQWGTQDSPHKRHIKQEPFLVCICLSSCPLNKQYTSK